jgi:hypothetical protein
MKSTSFPFSKTLVTALVAALALLTLSSCSLYPLGDSHYPHYFGGHGSAARPTNHVPASIQRNNAMLP